MCRNLFLFTALLGILPVASNAATIFTLNLEGCTTGCNVVPFATITLTMGVSGPGSVHVNVLLANDYGFRKAQDSNHHAFAFNLSGSGTVSIQNITNDGGQTFAYLGTASNMNPYGSFGYILDCTTCVSGATSSPTRQLEFDVVRTGLTTSNFVANAGGYYMAIDVVGLTTTAGLGNTGSVTTNTPGVSNPEPASVVLVLPAMAVLVYFRRRRLNS